ncbi:hypothetical protein [Sagittula sp. SSi028]|uniref:hypothetical protein n=1 Tax=Sagittula sp. SSi028 TaxID=3400636 RepID=UPI003AF7C2E0
MGLATAWFVFRLLQELAEPDAGTLSILLNATFAVLLSIALAVILKDQFRATASQTLRVDDQGIHLPNPQNPTTIPWNTIQRLEINRAGDHLLRSYIIHQHKGQEQRTVLPLARLAPEQATQALEVIARYTSANDPR